MTDERDAWAMREREPGDPGPFYTLHPEAMDSDGPVTARHPKGGVAGKRVVLEGMR